MTSRSLWEPASGAKVMVELRMEATLSMSSRVKESARREGRERLTMLGFDQDRRLSVSSFTLV